MVPPELAFHHISAVQCDFELSGLDSPELVHHYTRVTCGRHRAGVDEQLLCLPPEEQHGNEPFLLLG